MKEIITPPKQSKHTNVALMQRKVMIMIFSTLLICIIVAGFISKKYNFSLIRTQNNISKNEIKKGDIAMPSLSFLEFRTDDHRAVEDSRKLRLVGKVGSGITAIDVWSSCDDDTYRVKGYKKGAFEFSYNISSLLGNLCREGNDYIIKAYSGNVLLTEQRTSLLSNVGLIVRSDLPLLRFLDQHTLDQSRSIEDKMNPPVRMTYPPNFYAHCTQKDVSNNDTNTLQRINENVGIRIGVSIPIGSGSLANTLFSFYDRQNEDFVPSKTIPPLVLSGCYSGIDPFVLMTSSKHIIISRSNEEDGFASFFNGSTWLSVGHALLQQIPLLEIDRSVGDVRVVVYDDTIGLIETDETREPEYGTKNYRGEAKNIVFPEQRAEYLLSGEDLSFIGVVWHRKR